jgi:all-trans-retinol 13,14-reductase
MLSKEGRNVCVLEKHRKFGGNLQSFKRGEYSFDTGLHYVGSLGPNETLYNYWKYFGLTGLPWVPMDPDGFDIISLGDSEYPIAQGFDHFRNRLAAFLPGSEQALLGYTDKLREIAGAHPLYNLEIPDPGMRDGYQSQKASDFLNVIASEIEHRTTNIEQRLINILLGNNLLYAGNPDTTPLHQFGLINHSFITSAWRPAGGSQQIADKLVEGIRRHGGTVVAKSEVTRIRSAEGGYIISAAGGAEYRSAQVISDMHPAATLNLLDGIPVQKAFSERIRGLENTGSVFSVYLGLRPGAFRYLNHNIYHFTSGKVWTSEISGDGGWPGAFLLMTPPSKEQGEWADTVVILAPARFGDFTQWENSLTGRRDKSYWIFRAQQTQRLLEAVFEKFPDLRHAIATIDISTPLTWRDFTGTPQGAMYGIARNAEDPLRSTVLPKTKIPGLYFTGQSVNLHGAVGVTIGAVMTCGEILGLPHVLKTIRHAL